MKLFIKNKLKPLESVSSWHIYPQVALYSSHYFYLDFPCGIIHNNFIFPLLYTLFKQPLSGVSFLSYQLARLNIFRSLKTVSSSSHLLIFTPSFLNSLPFLLMRWPELNSFFSRSYYNGIT